MSRNGADGNIFGCFFSSSSSRNGADGVVFLLNIFGYIIYDSVT